MKIKRDPDRLLSDTKAHLYLESDGDSKVFPADPERESSAQGANATSAQA